MGTGPHGGAATGFAPVKTMMSRLGKLIVTGLVTMLSLTTAALPAHATTDAARAAATWVAEQSGSLTKVGEVADAALAIAAAQDPTTLAQAEPLLDLLAREGAAAVAESPETAAKLVVVAAAFGKDPRTFVPGTDLVAVVTDAIAEDGSFGAWPGPFASGLAAVALDRAGEAVPAALTTHLLTYANEDGGFGFGAGEPSDADSTGMALLGLLADGSDATSEATEKARAWATANQAEDGSWPGYIPVNSTAIMGGALASAGGDPAGAVTYLTGQQAASGAFTNAGADDFIATTQAALLLGGASYLDVTAGATPDATPSESPAAAPTAASTAVAVPASPDAVPATTAPASPPATTDGGSAPPGLIGAGVLALVLVVGWAVLRRTRATR